MRTLLYCSYAYSILLLPVLTLAPYAYSYTLIPSACSCSLCVLSTLAPCAYSYSLCLLLLPVRTLILLLPMCTPDAMRILYYCSMSNACSCMLCYAYSLPPPFLQLFLKIAKKRGRNGSCACNYFFQVNELTFLLQICCKFGVNRIEQNLLCEAFIPNLESIL